MAKTAVVKDNVYREHKTSDYHPERPERLDAIYEAIDEGPLADVVTALAPRPAAFEELALVHEEVYIDRIEETRGKDRIMLDADTHACARTADVARLAAGGVLVLVDAVFDGSVDNGFALIRPPGHHAEADKAMGFCIYNNVAVAARYAQKRHGVERVLVIDWDLHHGNGTQHIFYDDPSVLYFSVHQYPYYPGSGAIRETGDGKGEGFTVNVPVPPDQNDDDYVQVFRRIVTPLAAAFKPELIVVSAGFDPYFQDPLGGMRLTEEGFARLAANLLAAAHSYADGRIVFCLEGGYHLGGLARSTCRVLDTLVAGPGAGAAERPGARPGIDDIIEKVIDAQERYWPFLRLGAG